MIQTYPLYWLIEGLAIGLMAFCLWPVVMAVFCTWRLYKLSKGELK